MSWSRCASTAHDLPVRSPANAAMRACMDQWQRRRQHLEQAEKAAASWVVAQRVARIREGFEWVLKESCLTAADLISLPRFPRIPANGKPTTIDPSIVRMRKFFVEPHKDGGRVFSAHGMIAADLRLDEPGSYAITVTAKGVRCENVDPVLNVYLDHCRAASLAISSKEFFCSDEQNCQRVAQSNRSLPACPA